MSNFSRFLFAIFIFFTSNIFAEDYYYVAPYGSYGNGKGPTAYSACQGLIGKGSGDKFKVVSVSPYPMGGGSFSFFCGAKNKSGDTIGDGLQAGLRGSSCPTNQYFDLSAGGCVKPPEPESFEFLFCYNYDGGDGCAAGTNKGRPDSFCKNGIKFSADYNPSTTDASCYSYGNGDGTSGPAIMCSVTGTPTDQSCKTDYKTDTPDNSCPAGTVSGEFNNKRVCIPSGTGGGNGDGGEDGDNSGDGDGDGDGSGGETGGDGDGNGSDGDGDGTGSGGNSGGGNNGGGGSSGGGDGNGDGNGTGNGSGNGTGDGEGEGEEEGIGSGQGVEFCESGRCEFGDEKSDFFDGEVRTYSESMSAIFEGMQNSPLNSAISNIKFPQGGTCPTGSMSIDIGIGVIPLTFEEHCNFWEQISPVLSAAFLALWSVIAVRVFLSA